MVDLFGADKGNISLPPRLRPPEVLDGQEPDELKQVMILNMQTAFYQVRITDIAKRIERLQSRNTQLEESCVAEELLRSKTDVETADQIAQLNRQIFGEMEKITDYQKRIQTVQKWMDEEKQEHLDKVEAVNKKYTKTRMAITAEIQVLNAKMNTLEEYKTAKSDLRNKLTARNNLILQRDEDTKQRCEQIQRKFKIGREKLKKEMYVRLQGLAGTFQMEVAAYVAKPIHRLMRENIFVKNELIDIVRESVPKKEEMKRKKETDDKIMYKTATSKKGTVQQLIVSKIQGHLLTAVKEQYTRVKNCVEKLKDSDNGIELVEFTYGCAKIRADKAMQYISRLETGLHRQQTELGLVNYLRDRSKIELQRCIDVLDDAKYAAACALKKTDSGKDVSEMGNTQLMSYLLSILSKGDTQRWKNRTPSLATVPPPEEAYKIGDLGFDPSHIELNRPDRETIEKKASKLSTLKILEDLGIRLSGGVSPVRSQIKPWQMDIIDLADFEESANSISLTSDEKVDEAMGVVSSLSLYSEAAELDQKPTQLEVVKDEEPEAVGENEAEMEGKVKTEEKVAENEAVNQGEVDDSEIITGEDEKYGSETLVAENKETFSEENGIQE